MHWNYRIIKNADYFSINEVFYNSNKEICGVSDNEILVGRDIKELEKSLDTLFNDYLCFKNKIINLKTIKYAAWDSDNDGIKEFKRK